LDKYLNRIEIVQEEFILASQLTIHTKSYPRAALIGNPSDGYNGKTIAFLFSNFSVDIELYESAELNLIPGSRDKLVYASLEDLSEDIQSYGYYGGIRLLKAVIKKFIDYCRLQEIRISNQNFTIRYESNIPQRLGLAGSSAIITAALRAILKFYDIEIPPPLFANLVLSAETEELSISAGLQDRVAQAYEVPVFMDFNAEILVEQGYGRYVTISKDFFPPLYIAYKTCLAEGSEVFHNDLKQRFENGDIKVLEAMKKFAEITDNAYDDLISNNSQTLGSLMNENFDLRSSISKISAENLQMIKIARSQGASAKFTGSGGAIIGTYTDEKMFNKLKEAFRSNQIEILKPEIVDNSES
jgi:glucuronokinase